MFHLPISIALKKYSLFIAAILISIASPAQEDLQSVTIEMCYDLAKANFPLTDQLDLIEQTKEYTLENVSKGYLPKLSINGQASYQSAVTEIPLDLPGVSLPEIGRDQYKIYGEAYLPLTERLNIKAQNKIIDANARIEKQEIEVELYKLYESINQIYFSILLIDEQIVQSNLLLSDLQSAIDKTKAAIENGTATSFNADLLLAELLKAEQKVSELYAGRKGFLRMLSTITNQNLDDSTKLNRPIILERTSEVKRPELLLFNMQTFMINDQYDALNNRRIPRLGLFMQSGVGRPALNFLKSDFEFYYLGGVRLNWNLSDMYSLKNDKSILDLKRSVVQSQKEAFILRTSLNLEQQVAEIDKIEALIESDERIISVRNRIKETAVVQLDNGIISALDFTTFLNMEYQAKQNLSTHQILLLKALYDYQTITGR